MPDHVLVPMDHSPPSKAALTHALALHQSAEVTVLHVLNPTDVVALGGAMDLTATEATVEAPAEDLFAEVRELAADHGRDVTTETERGPIPRTISAYASERDIDLIVMGSHGRQGVTRLLLGSVAEQVVRRAPVPVTVVR